MPSPTGAFNRLPKIARALEDRVGKVNRVAAFNIQERAAQSMGGFRSGRIYKLHGGIVHAASLPGEPPAILFGTLVNSIFVETPNPWLAFVYSADEKAPHLEFGTVNMAARPWLTPAANAEKGDYVHAMAVAIAGASRA